MSLNDVSIEYPSGTTTEFGVVSVNGRDVIRNSSSATAILPDILEIAQTPGTKSRPQRTLIKRLTTVQSPDDPMVFSSPQVHVVITFPADGVATTADLVNQWGQLRAYLTDTKFAEIASGMLG